MIQQQQQPTKRGSYQKDVPEKLATSFYKGLVILFCWMFWWNRIVDQSALLLAKERAAVASYVHQLGNDAASTRQPTRNVTIFYHTFAQEFIKRHSHPSYEYQRVDQIVQEQIQQVGQASQQQQALARNQSALHYVLKYTSVGIPHLVNESFVQALCQPYHATMTCQFQGHTAVGHEEVTLAKILSHCQQQDDDSLVAYIHTKGSLHPKVANHVWRRHLTQAAVSPHCLDALQRTQQKTKEQQHNTNPQCNVCGLQFMPIWIQMFPGNFFSARCDYIRQLLPLDQHSHHMDDITHTIRTNIREDDSSMWHAWVFPWIKDSLGVDRWAREAWVGSHPRLQPCDMAHNVTTIFQHDADSAAALVAQGHVQPAPRVPGDQGDYYRLRLDRWQQIAYQEAPLQRPHEYFMLPGTLYRTYRLYGQFPPSESWIWKWFPHGASWRDKVEALLYNLTNGTVSLDRQENTTLIQTILDESMLW